MAELLNYRRTVPVLFLIVFYGVRHIQGSLNAPGGNSTSRCTSAEPTVTLQSYSQHCKPYINPNGAGYCKDVTGNETVYGTLYKQKKEEEGLNRLKFGKVMLVAYGLTARSSCVVILDQVYCHWSFPACDTTASTIKRRPVCRETCELLMKMCDKEFVMLKGFNERIKDSNYWDIINCSTLPKTNGGANPECFYHTKLNTETDKLQSAGCYYGNGLSYQGSINTTRSGHSCQSWSTQCPHRHRRTPENYRELVNASNSCRNPGGQGLGGPWCYTTDPNVRWEYCDVQKCVPPPPTRAPVISHIHAINSSAIQLEWTKIPDPFIHGILMGYRVIYKIVSHGIQRSAQASQDQHTIVLIGLNGSSNVTVQVLAFNKNGPGPLSNSVFVVTLPERLSVVRFQVALTGEIFTSKLLNRTSDSFRRMSQIVTRSLRGLFAASKVFEIYDIIIIGFRNGSVIADVQIMAEYPEGRRKRDIDNAIQQSIIKSARDGRIGSLPVKSVIIKEAPQAPENVASKDVKRDSIQVTWSPTKFQEEYQIHNYTIQFQGPKRSSFLEGDTVEAGETEGNIEGLSAGTDYQVRVMANNQFGSTPSDVIHVQTAEGLAGFLLILTIVLPIVLVVALMAAMFFLRKRNRRLAREVEERHAELEQLAAMQGNIQHIYDSNIDIFEILGISTNRTWLEIARKDLECSSELGSGAFGVVKKGSLRREGSKEPLICAVKMLKEKACEKDLRDFCNELNIMDLVGDHPNVVSLIGACTTGGPLWVVVKFAKNGCLLDYLKKQTSHNYENCPAEEQTVPAPLTYKQKLKFAHQIAKGMDHLSSKMCIHRDLASRNILLSDDYTAMVCDFGLSRDIYESGAYENTNGGMLPVRWMALESLEEWKYTCQSDVWSFGIVLWEIESGGKMPYPGMDGTEIVDKLRKGYRLPRPTNCSDVMNEVMTECWKAEPKERPTFKKMLTKLDKHLCELSEYVEFTDDTRTSNHPYDRFEMKNSDSGMEDDGEMQDSVVSNGKEEESPEG